jgi:hypothetical protein
MFVLYVQTPDQNVYVTKRYASIPFRRHTHVVIVPAAWLVALLCTNAECGVRREMSVSLVDLRI